MQKIPLAVVSAALALSCSPSQSIVSRDVEGRVTVAHGVYGQTVIFGDESGDDGPLALGNYTFDVTAVNTTTAMAIQTDDVGFYQLTLDAGVYTICAPWNACGNFTVPAAGVVRFDYDFGTSLGWHVVTGTTAPDAGP